MPLSRPTLTEIIARVSGDIKASIAGATTLALRSVLLILGRVFAKVAHALYDYADNITLQLFATTAEGQYLETLGTEVGVLRKASTYATGAVTVIGAPTTIIPADTELVSDAGNIYTVDTATTIPGAGTVSVDITAQLAGADSNELAAVVLTFVSPIIGVTSEATVTADGLTGGTDEETDTAYRSRILFRKRYPPHGGNQTDLEAWTREVSGVTRAWVYPLYYGDGTVAVFFVRDEDASIFPTPAQITTVQNYLISHTDPTTGLTVGIPVTMEPGLFVLAPSAKSVDMSIGIYPNTAEVRAAVEAEIEALLLDKGGPALTVYISDINAAIASAAGWQRHRLTVPAADVSAAFDEVHVLGTITWSDY